MTAIIASTAILSFLFGVGVGVVLYMMLDIED